MPDPRRGEWCSEKVDLWLNIFYVPETLHTWSFLFLVQSWLYQVDIDWLLQDSTTCINLIVLYFLLLSHTCIFSPQGLCFLLFQPHAICFQHTPSCLCLPALIGGAFYESFIQNYGLPFPVHPPCLIFKINLFLSKHCILLILIQ